MDPILDMKRGRENGFKKCIICEDDKYEKLLNASEQGFATLKESASTRHKLRENNVVYKIAIETIVIMQDDISPVWHKAWYSSFTSKSKISTLEKRQASEMCASSSVDECSRYHTLCDSTQPIHWALCMFCQKSGATKLSAVTTFKMSQKILNASKYHQILSIQLSSSMT